MFEKLFMFWHDLIINLAKNAIERKKQLIHQNWTNEVLSDNWQKTKMTKSELEQKSSEIMSELAILKDMEAKLGDLGFDISDKLQIVRQQLKTLEHRALFVSMKIDELNKKEQKNDNRGKTKQTD